MSAEGATKLLTFTGVGPNATAHGWWNNANAEVYRLNAWPKVGAGVTASAEITKVSEVVHGSPSERELHFYVKNTGATTIDIDVWAFWWNWTFDETLEDVRAEFNVPAIGGALVTKSGIKLIDVAGIRKHGSSVPAEVGDRWHLGSDTKAMTATLLGVLAQRGDVDWDLTVAQAFPEWSQTINDMFKATTFERLMAHRSGIVDVSTDEWNALGDTSVPEIPKRRREFAHLITHREHGVDPAFDIPGSVFSYQNANFILAGAVLERCTGKSWEDLMKTEIFEPLHMASAGFGAPGSANNVNEPWGHSDATGQRVPNKGDNTPGLGPAGTVHASLADWAKFIRLHLDGSEGSLTLSPATLNHLHTQYPPNFFFANRYGWGWGFGDEGSGVLLGHDGSNGSWYCSCQLLLGQGVGFLAVSNIGGGPNGKGDLACWKVIEKLREWHYQPLP